MKTSELKKMTVKALRELAMENSDLTGVSGMKKDELVEALTTENDEAVKKTAAKPKVKKEIIKLTKETAKTEIARLKKKREELLSAGNPKSTQMKNLQRRIRNLKRFLKIV